MQKATHKGQCQCCGQYQKLPGGVLSQHGYRVLWSQFVGVCAGAGHQPYELSCDLIQSFIASAQTERARLVAFQAELRQPATEAKGWSHEYMGRPFQRRRGYEWRQVEIRQVEGHPRVLEYKNHEDNWRRLDLYGHNWITLLDVATIMNRRRADALNADIEQLDRYIAWQQQRVRDWKPADLTPIAERAA